jgi:hypothetical protein
MIDRYTPRYSESDLDRLIALHNTERLAGVVFVLALVNLLVTLGVAA